MLQEKNVEDCGYIRMQLFLIVWLQNSVDLLHLDGKG